MNDITIEQWRLIEPILTSGALKDKRFGRPAHDPYRVLQGIVWVLRSGSRWKDLPSKYPSYQTCHRRFQQWTELGIFRRALKKLVGKLKVDFHESYIDGSFSLAKKGGKKVGKCLKGKGSKLMAIIDKNAIPISLTLENASSHESSLVNLTIQNRLTNHKPRRLIGDKAYDSDPLDKRLKQIGIEMIAPDRECRKKPSQDKRKTKCLKRRWTIERYFSWLKSFRRLVIRWEHKHQNFESMILLAAICLLLRDF